LVASCTFGAVRCRGQRVLAWRSSSNALSMR
jgi:hypothetical protein